ncbi:MAG: hypothetical protein WAL93_01610 [Desulfobacterales bacterium]
MPMTKAIEKIFQYLPEILNIDQILGISYVRIYRKIKKYHIK